MQWEFIDTGVRSAEENMATDAELLKSLSEFPRPILHTYKWHRPSITYGYFIKPFDLLNQDSLSDYAIDLARRPTGGGITLHLGDLAYSVLIPAGHPNYSLCTLTNYAYIHSMLSKAIQRCFSKIIPELVPQPLIAKHPSHALFCMAHPIQYDLLIKGKKVAGGAQRRTKYGFLHQGTVCLTLVNPTLLQKILKNSETLPSTMASMSFPLLEECGEPKEDLMQCLYAIFKEESYVKTCAS